jgi:phosphatidylserine synthase 2
VSSGASRRGRCAIVRGRVATGTMEAKKKQPRARHAEDRRPPHPATEVYEYDPWTAWLYKPHTISVLVVGACLLM